MSAADSVIRAGHLLSLSETRALIRRAHARMMAVFFGVLFAILSMFVGGMLLLARFQGGYTWTVLWASAFGQSPWNYPGLLIVAPWGVVTLPLLETVTMVLVSAGVGLSSTVAILLVVPLVRGRMRAAGARSAGVGSGIGATPAITGLACLGACCCSTCATGGIAVVAAASGTSVGYLLTNNWYLSIFELAVVYIALLAQERNLRPANAAGASPLPCLDGRAVFGVVLRLALIVAGVTWSLAMFVEWGSTNPATAPAALWYHWIFEHQLLAITAVAAGMFPREFSALVRGVALRLRGYPLRLALLVAGLTWGTWVPPPLGAAGLGGLVNELLGYLGAPISMGAVPPDSPLGAALIFHWAFQHLLLASFGIAVAVAPVRATAPLLWSVGEGAPAQPLPAPNPSPAQGPVPSD